jgi:ABC-type Mn2+/Zn2+ transport system ATPase subunit
LDEPFTGLDLSRKQKAYKLFALVIASSLIAVLFESVCLAIADGAQRRLQ